MSDTAIRISTCPHPPGWDLNGVMALAQGRPVPRDRVLRLAAFLVKQVVATLDTHASPCGECGLTRAINWPEAELHKRLRGMETKLTRAADQLAALNGGP